MRFVYLALIICLFTFLANARGAYLLYKKQEIGSEKLYNPVFYYFNSAFDTIQNPYYFTQKDFLRRHQKVYNYTLHPHRSIKSGGGYWKLFKDEFVSSRSFPNYFLHTIGGGHDFIKLKEWYQDNNFPSPYIFSFITTYIAAFGNEALESSGSKYVGPHDHIADLLFFDLAGKIIFLNDDVVIFFRDEMGLVMWPYQPMFGLVDEDIHNAGLNYVFRPKVFGKESALRPFAFVGMQVMGGLTYNFRNEDNISLGMGAAFIDPLNNKSKLAFGAFYDRGGNLLSSLIINGSENFRVRLNIFPGILGYKNFQTGLMMGFDREDQAFLGVNLNLPLGLSRFF